MASHADLRPALRRRALLRGGAILGGSSLLAPLSLASGAPDASVSTRVELEPSRRALSTGRELLWSDRTGRLSRELRGGTLAHLPAAVGLNTDVSASASASASVESSTLAGIPHHASPYIAAAALAGGELALLDRERARLQLLTADGTPRGSLSLQDIAPRPSAMLAGSDGLSLWLADSAHHQLTLIDLDGRILRRWGGQPWQRHASNGPVALARDSRGHLHSLESGHGCVLVWNERGECLGRYAEGLSPGVRHLAPAARDTLYTLDTWQNRLQALLPGKRHLTALHLGQDFRPAQLAHVAGRGYLLTA